MMISAACFGAKAVFLNTLCEAACSVNTTLSHRRQRVSRAVLQTASPTSHPALSGGKGEEQPLHRHDRTRVLIRGLPFTQGSGS